jgi:hypothetical protein
VTTLERFSARGHLSPVRLRQRLGRTRRRLISGNTSALLVLLVSGPIHVQTREPELLLFGERDHKTFLGCLNCSRYESSSVCNRYGEYGSRYNEKSIWNRYGSYGSRFSDTSPWNKYASTPPVIVDASGNFFGYFASNRYQSQRTEIKAYRVFLDKVEEVNQDLVAASDVFCGR